MSVFPPQAHFHLMAKPSSFHCNIQCEYCFYLEKSEQFGQYAPFMSKDTLKHYVKNYIQSHAGNVVEFAWQGGEPTLLGLDFYKQAVEYQQEFAQGKQITNAFQTNGIALNQQWAAFFKQHHFLIGLSIDGLSAVHNRYRISGNGNPTFEKVVKALNLLQEYGVEFNTLTVINDQNWQKGRETYLVLKQLGSTYMQFIPIVERHTQTQSVTDFSVPSEGYEQFLVDVFHELREAEERLAKSAYLRTLDRVMDSLYFLKQHFPDYNWTYREIAEYAGCETETAIRIAKELKQNGALDRISGHK